MLKIFRSPRADFEHDAERAHQVYTEDELRRIADAGFNAVWIRVIYRRLFRHRAFPEFGGSAAWLGHLRSVAKRGEKVGVKLVVYCQEPFGLSQSDPFWKNHCEAAGATWDYPYGTESAPGPMRALCVSSTPVRDFLAEASGALVRELPGLGGVVTITASEFMSHCYSHYATNVPDDRQPPPLNCPRCRKRPSTDVVADVLNLMRQGMDSADPTVPLIAWNWSWVMYEPDPQPHILNRLAPGIDVQADFERGDTKTDPTGREIEINEYSLSFVGPSNRFLEVRNAARRQGRRVFAKLQIGTTHELATVSNLPLIDRLFRKAARARKIDIEGFMGCWNFGNELSLNTIAFNFFLSDACPPNEEEALARLADREFPGCRPESVIAAWHGFGEAFDYYPFSIPFLYYSPINYALALPLRPGPLHAKPIGRSWLLDPRDDRDDPSRCFGPFTPEDIAERLVRMSKLWGKALDAYENGLANAEGSTMKAAELAAARAVYACLRSTANYFRLYLLRRTWRDNAVAAFREIARDELCVLEDALPVYEQDPRQGFHIEGHGYMVTPALIRAKALELRSVLAV
ncbi:MAG: hypothetical protein GXP31_07710 [Kiritimatiellaeota bacterium]|nr:hypothetical protein [Kiritimatiellota bacterium]